jgi:hypothetical protein
MGSGCRRSWRWRACYLSSEGACRRGVAYAGVPFFCFLSGLPWWCRDESGGSAPGGQLPLFECDLRSCSGGCFCGVLPHLACRGGVEVGQDDEASSGAGGGIWKPPENRLLAALPMR